MKAYPVPSPITPVLDVGNYFTIPFRNWFRDISLFWNNTNTNVKSNVNYTIVGSLVFINYSGSDTKITLPLPNKLKTFLKVVSDGELKVIEVLPNISEVSLTGSYNVINDFYFKGDN